MSVPWRAHQGIDAYLEWVGDAIDQSGGYLDADCRGVDYLYTYPLVADDGEPFAEMIDQHCLRFHDRTHLHFHQLVTVDVEVFEYAYQYMQEDGWLIVRLCKNAYHEADLGTPTHAHMPTDESGRSEIVPSEEVAFNGAIDFIYHLEGGAVDPREVLSRWEHP